MVATPILNLNIFKLK